MRLFNLSAAIICTAGVVWHTIQLSKPEYKVAHHINKFCIVIGIPLAIANFVCTFL